MVFASSISVDGFRHFAGEELVAPPLLWSEVPSALHEARWRGELTGDVALEALRRFERAPLSRRAPQNLLREAWRIADEFGWAKTYDAEFVALAGLLRCRLVTLDLRLRRAAGALGYVIGPTEI